MVHFLVLLPKETFSFLSTRSRTNIHDFFSCLISFDRVTNNLARERTTGRKTVVNASVMHFLQKIINKFAVAYSYATSNRHSKKDVCSVSSV